MKHRRTLKNAQRLTRTDRRRRRRSVDLSSMPKIARQVRLELKPLGPLPPAEVVTEADRSVTPRTSTPLRFIGLKGRRERSEIGGPGNVF